MNTGNEHYLAISGGIGGAKLVLGLSHVLPAGGLTVIANTGDDFEHLGLTISPDMDTLLYTLAGINNTELGWGRADESWNFAAACAQIGMDTWFRLGDRDLAVHLYRSQRLRAGASLSEVTSELCQRFGVQVAIVPMSDTPVRTLVECERGTLAFQEYFVKYRCEPRVKAIRYAGIDNASPARVLSERIDDAGLRAIIICPSNPFLSIAPVLAVPGLRAKLAACGKPVIVVSPVVDGQSLKGPTAKMMGELDLACSVETIASLYRDIATIVVIDHQDAGLAGKITSMGLRVHCTDIIMQDLQDKVRLATELCRLPGDRQ